MNRFLEEKLKIGKWAKFIIISTLIVLLLEVTLFNIKFYRTIFNKNEEKIYLSQDFESLHENGCYIVYLTELNTEVKSIFIEMEGCDSNKTIDYDIFYSDETSNNRFLATKSYDADVENTKYTTMELSRKSEKHRNKNK